jgi:hypothetical protein
MNSPPPSSFSSTRRFGDYHYSKVCVIPTKYGFSSTYETGAMIYVSTSKTKLFRHIPGTSNTTAGQCLSLHSFFWTHSAGFAMMNKPMKSAA